MADWKDSIVLLTSTDQGNQGFGTGFVFHRDSTGRCFLLTCLHVVTTLERPGKGAADDAPPPGVLAADQPAEVWVRGDGILDLAVLAVDGLDLEPLRLGRPAQRGTSIQTAGFTDFEVEQKTVVPRPLAGTVRDNNPVWSRRPRARLGAWSLDIAIDAEQFRALTEGYSGSPVLDPASGAVIGIMNLKRHGSATAGHAVCVRTCDQFDPPLAQRLPDYPPDPSAPPTSPARSVAGTVPAGTLAWLASTMDHTKALEQIARCLADGRGGSRSGVWFSAFDACLSDCPRALAEHLAVRFGGRRPGAPRLDELVTELHPVRYDGQGLWQALVDQIAPAAADQGQAAMAERQAAETERQAAEAERQAAAAERQAAAAERQAAAAERQAAAAERQAAAAERQAAEAERILHWINAGPAGSPGGLRVVYCQLSVADQGRRIAELIAGAIQAFSGFSGLSANARVLFLFACVFEESSRWGLLERWRRPRLGRLPDCTVLGALAKLSLIDVDNWLSDAARAGPGGRRLDEQTRQRLRDALEALFPDDAARLRYQQVRRHALAILDQATLAAPIPGDPA